MPASFQELLNSRLFKFVVGEKADGNPTVFHIHQEAIAQLSIPLHNVTKGGWMESKAGCTVWDDVKKDTFERLAQFAYTGDYSVPMTEMRTRYTEKQDATNNTLSNLNGIRSQCEYEEVFAIEEPAPPDDEVVKEDLVHEEIPEDFAYWGTWSSKKGNKKKWILGRDKYPRHPSSIYPADFHSLSFELLAPRNNHDKTCEPTEFFEPGRSYSNVFLCHASLYVLADYRLIDSLKVLALYKLHKTMCVFELDDDNAKDIVDLARYVYSEEGGGSRIDGGIGGLRKLVCQYMATNALALSFDDGFMELLAEGGQFVKDFFKFEVQRKS